MAGALFSTGILGWCLGGCTENAQRNWCAVQGRGILIIVDRTTPPTDAEQRQIRQSINAIREGLSGGDRLQLSSIEDIFANSSTHDIGCFPECSPNDGNCSAGIQLVDRSAFNADLDEAIDRVLTPAPEQSTSDVAATIAGVATSFAAERPVTELYVFSDMIENSRHLPSERLFALPVAESLSIVRDNRAIPDLNGARVHIVGMGRGHQIGRNPITAEQMHQLRDFWDAYFQEATGRPPSYESVITR
ncbi:MAG: hypothetical protein AB7Q23_15805 [Hyphomonadaceae bacterium]